MKYTQLFFAFSILLLPVYLRAQVNPDKINNALLKKSVKAVLATKTPVEWHKIGLTDSVKKSLRGKLKAQNHVADTLFIGSVSTPKGTRYVIPDIAPSRSEQFSYVLYLDSSKHIAGVDVLQYRENYGNEIDYSFFRDQFKGKKDPADIIFGRSIQNISGATISARSITYAIHDLMLILNRISLP